MCEFIGFKVAPTKQGLTVKIAPSLNSHDDITGKGYECEWTKNELSIRVPPDQPDSKAEIIHEWIMSQYHDRDAFIKAMAIKICKRGQLPNIWNETFPNWDDRTKRLFACRCVRKIWELLTDERSRHAVEVAEKFVNGEATDQELSAARVAAYAAAYAAARAAAYAARAAADAAAYAAAYAAADAAYAAAHKNMIAKQARIMLRILTTKE